MEQYRRLFRFLVIVIVVALFFSYALPNRIALVDCAEAGKYGDIVPTSFELALLEKINENRTQQGAGRLKINATLWWVARAHSQDMIDNDFFDHKSSQQGPFSGATFSERVKNHAGYENSYIGECIAMRTGGVDVEWCMSAWKNSPPHWDIIINPDLKEVGLGIRVGNWDGYPNSALYTADFGGASVSVDLTLDASQIVFNPSSPDQGDYVNITATIQNDGNTDAYPVKVKFYDGDPNSGGMQIGNEKEIPHILIQGESAPVSANWDTRGKSQDHDIYVIVDENDQIAETNENNNVGFASISINIPKPPINLDYGWNLISFPYIVSDSSIEPVLSSIAGQYDRVSTYDAFDSNDRWKNHVVQKPNALNDLEQLDNKIGFWVDITDVNGAQLYVNGKDPSSPETIILNKGWNLVGYPSATIGLRADALNNLEFGNQIDAIQTFNGTSGLLEYLEDGMFMEPGLGYFVHATQDCQWIVN